MSIEVRYHEKGDGPRPGMLKRAATATFVRAANIQHLIVQFARRWRTQRAGGQTAAGHGDRLALPENKDSRRKSLSRSRSPTHQPEEKIRPITYRELMILLHSGKEVLVAFYDNDNVSLAQIWTDGRVQFCKRS